MAKSEFLQIRITPEDKQRIEDMAAANHLDASTWARQVLLKALPDKGKQRPGRIEKA